MVIDTSTELIRDPVSALEDCQMAFIGCGAMAEAMIAGLLRKKLISANNVVGSHPRQARREELHVKYGIEM
ncbi:MAG TPA: NAD(P)-binding domain-containing protein, partial [Pyrinomonadaceae bacterium]|nr:NAD(P)-binding domain-containing protein [Pyrinomonadaceae bacterium]